MSFLIAIEGADGVGKNTAAHNVVAAITANGQRATVISFPRYGHTIGGTTLGDFLSGRLTIPVTPSSLAVLYALDRFESRQVIDAAVSSHDVVVFDRYIASNVAYQGAKVSEGDRTTFMEWIVRLETEVFNLPPPDLNIYLDTPFEIAHELMLSKGNRSYTERSYDEHESDSALQERVRAVYEQMAAHRMLGNWEKVRTVDGDRLMGREAIATQIVRLITQLYPSDFFNRS